MFPAFFSPQSGFSSPFNVCNPEEAAKLIGISVCSQHWSSSPVEQLPKADMLFCSQHALAGPQKWCVVGGAHPRGARSSWPADRGSDTSCSDGGKVCRHNVITRELICAGRIRQCLFIPLELKVSQGETWHHSFFKRSMIWPKESPFRPVSSWPENTIT